MKKISLVVIGLAVVTLMSSCNSSKKVSKSDEFTEIKIPCADKGRSSSKYFRASNVGISKDMATSREKALLLTKQRLASLINSRIKSVTERYVNDMDAGGASEFSQTFENMTKDVVNQQLTDVVITCEKVGKKNDGIYQTYVAIEVDKDAILNGVEKKISRDKKLEVMYDREKFRKNFDAEMKKLENEYK